MTKGWANIKLAGRNRNKTEWSSCIPQGREMALPHHSKWETNYIIMWVETTDWLCLQLTWKLEIMEASLLVTTFVHNNIWYVGKEQFFQEGLINALWYFLIYVVTKPNCIITMFWYGIILALLVRFNYLT